MSLFDTINPIELTIVKVLNAYQSYYLNIFFILVLNSIFVFMIFLVFFYFKKKDRNRLFHLIITAVLGYLFVVALKFLFARQRPYELEPSINKILVKIDPSFPSSHAFAAFLALNFIPRNFAKSIKSAIYFYLVFLIPIASMVTGVHFLSDVVGGAIVGLILPRILSQSITSKFLNRIF